VRKSLAELASLSPICYPRLPPPSSRDGGAPPHAHPSGQVPLPAGAATLALILRTEDLIVRFSGLPAPNQVHFEASETKGPCLDVIAPPTR
jgi:hypothetical protein